jgi:hypothetical protein
LMQLSLIKKPFQAPIHYSVNLYLANWSAHLFACSSQQTPSHTHSHTQPPISPSTSRMGGGFSGPLSPRPHPSHAHPRMAPPVCISLWQCMCKCDVALTCATMHVQASCFF